MEYLALTLLGNENPSHMNELFKLISHCGCSVTKSRATLYGSELSAQLFLSGTWSAIAKLEANLSAFEKNQNLKCLSTRTKEKKVARDQLSYFSYITTVAGQQVVYKISQFLHDQGIQIHDMSVSNYKEPINEITMLSISLSFTIPASQLVADFRESFVIFCDDNNYDITIEPQKNFMQI